MLTGDVGGNPAAGPLQEQHLELMTLWEQRLDALRSARTMGTCDFPGKIVSSAETNDRLMELQQLAADATQQQIQAFKLEQHM